MSHTLDHLILIWRILILMLQLLPADIFGNLWSGAFLMSGILGGGNTFETDGAGARMPHVVGAATHKG